MKQPDEEITPKRTTDDLTKLQIYAKAIARKDFLYNLTSPEIGILVKALVEFKKDMPDLKTDKTYAGAFKSRYQSLPCMLNIINPSLAKHSLSIAQPIHTILDTTYIITYLMHTSGQYIKSITALPEQEKSMGKLISLGESQHLRCGCITYLKRHALKSILGVDADDDTDGHYDANYNINKQSNNKNSNTVGGVGGITWTKPGIKNRV